jgi:NitT/TauT family transport system permease protein
MTAGTIARRKSTVVAEPRQRPELALRLCIQIGALAAVVLAWLFLIPALDVPSYLWPSLPDVVTALRQTFIELPRQNGWTSTGTGVGDMLSTLYTTLIGYGLGSAIAVVLAVGANEFRILGYIIQPFISALQSLPKIALAPLFLVWFGLGFSGHVALVVSLVIFPVMLNAYDGLRFVPEEYLELAQTARASRWRTLVQIKLPAALPALFTGLSVGIVYALLAAIVAEFLSGQTGLGAELVIDESNSNTPAVFAILVVLGLLGAALNAIVAVLGHRLVFWAGKH